jgi:hypothetical protein
MLQMIGTPAHSALMTASFQSAMEMHRHIHRDLTLSFENLDSSQRLVVIRWALAIAAKPTDRREAPSCLQVRATYSHSHRIRYFDCETCGLRYHAELIPLKTGPGPRMLILEKGFCSYACAEEMANEI